MRFLSVIVPVYHVEKYLSECIESIINQTFQDMEIILVDDGGDDLCPRICDEYAERDTRIHVVHKKNGGLVSARKAGLKIATGKYIAFVDGDDYIDRTMYEFLYKKAIETNADIVAEGFEILFPDKCEIWKDDVSEGFYNKEELEKKIYPVMMCHDNMLKRNVAPAIWCKIFKKELILQVLPRLDEEIKDGEDAAVTYVCLFHAQNAFFSKNSSHYKYRVNDVSMSRSFDKNWYTSASAYCKWMNKEFVEYDFYQMPESIALEKFMMLYRYLDREYAYSKCLNKKERYERIRMIRETTEIGRTIEKIDLNKLKCSFFAKTKFKFLKNQYYSLYVCVCEIEYVKNAFGL